MPKNWIEGKLEEVTVHEFVDQLRGFAFMADDEFCFDSSPLAHLGERLRAAADEIEKQSHTAAQ